MRHFRYASALLSALLLQSALISSVRAQPAPKPESEEAADAEEAPMDDEEAPPKDAPSADGSKPAAPPADSKEPAPPPPEEEPADEEMPSDAEMEAEADKELAAEEAAGAAALTKPPAKGKGAIVGVVTDAVEHETTPEAQISVVGTKYKAIADFDGRYRLELPPGTYTLRIYVELHKPSVLKGVEVKAGELERYDIDVFPDESSIDTVEIVQDVDHASVEGLLLTRQRSASVGDGVGRAEISRTPASNAAQATQRVVGATIVGNRFVYVRGLGERYTNSLLNGAPLPSPEPDRAAIPLDLFPSLILESVTIVKTFTPDMPADFAGGSVRIDTRELPTKPLFQLSLGGGVDSKATFRDRYTHPGSGTDWLGYDNNTRSLPDGFPKRGLGAETPPEEVVAAGRSINSSMHPRTALTPPNYAGTAVAGNGWTLPGDQRLGVLATLNYGRSYRVRKATRRDFQPDVEPGTGRAIITEQNNIHAAQGEDKVTWGSLGSVSYWPSMRHRLTLTGLHTQLADASTNVSIGTYENLQGEVRTAQLRYVSRALNMLQLRGEHDFPVLNKATLTWNASLSVASRAEPDTRTTVYDFNEVRQSWTADTTGAGGVHQFSDQSEKQRGGGLDWTQPITKNPDLLKLKVGGLLSSRDRDYSTRRLVFTKKRGADSAPFECGAVYSLNCPEKLYQWDNIGSALTVKESTFLDDAYRAKLDIYAGYAMVDATLFDDLRVVAGARVERTIQRITPWNQYTGEDQPGGEIKSTDVMPAVSLTYSATKKSKLRVAVSETIARPQIRELSPSKYTDYFGGRELSGNPQLQLTHIKNADLRLEHFPTPREVLAFSIFYKLFDAPIEPFVTSNTIVKFQNAEGARLVGLELEARKSLDFVSKSLADLSAIANLTLAHSQIELDPNQGKTGIIVTNRDRAMVNQAPYVVNVALDYENVPLALNLRLLGNVIGPRIVQVGTSGLDDQYEQPRYSLDLTASKGIGKHFQVRLNMINILNSPIVMTIGKARRADRETYRESEGRLYTLTGTYTY
jgi:TonB-dependent receptor